MDLGQSIVMALLIILPSFVLAIGFTYLIRNLYYCRLTGCCAGATFIAIIASPVIFAVGSTLLGYAGFLISLLAVSAGAFYTIIFLEDKSSI